MPPKCPESVMFAALQSYTFLPHIREHARYKVGKRLEERGMVALVSGVGPGGVRGIVADSKAYSRRTLGLCLEQEIGLVTLVPRTCAIRQGDVEAMSCQAEERGHGEANTMHQQAGTGRCAAGEYADWYTGDHGPGGRGESTGFHAPQHDRGKDQ